MKKRFSRLILAALALAVLAGCGTRTPAPETTAAPVMATIPQTEPAPAATVPEDGSDPIHVTRKGTYTGEPDMDRVVASVRDADLINEALQAWYWAAVANYQKEGHEVAPDFSQPLDTQICPLDDSVNSWQQYFLTQALDAWHTAQALCVQGDAKGLPVEAAFQPNEAQREEYMVDIPAMKYLYREEPYQPNSMHQAYLDSIPQLLDAFAKEQGYADASELARKAYGTTEAGLAAMADVYNRGYMYFTNLSDYIEVTPEEVEAWFAENEEGYAAQGITRDSGYTVDIRQILLVPEESEKEPGLTVEIAEDGSVICDEALWALCDKEAQRIVQKWWKHGRPGFESTFADFAHKYSKDTGTAKNGGAYRNIRQGQLIPELDAWCFAPEREVKDYTVIRSQYGCHILFFSGKTDIWYAQAEQDLIAQRQKELIGEAKDRYYRSTSYGAITLAQAEDLVTGGELLYPDVAHERFPEVPLYLQQDYGNTMYGAQRLRTHGCGITSMAMLTTYMTDDEYTPPEMCALLGRYSSEKGTDRTMFIYEPQSFGFYLIKQSFKPDEAKQALKDGYIVVSIQQKGYWTRAGHYLVIEKMFEDETIQVRDSNIFNYGRLEAHKQDRHEWSTIPSHAKSYWIFDNKITHIEICTRCGQHNTQDLRFLTSEYLCEKCRPATLRRDTYLAMLSGQ